MTTPVNISVTTSVNSVNQINELTTKVDTLSTELEEKKRIIEIYRLESKKEEIEVDYKIPDMVTLMKSRGYNPTSLAEKLNVGRTTVSATLNNYEKLYIFLTEGGNQK